MTQPYKVCPRCQTPTALDASICIQCGRQFKTHFPSPDDKTQSFTGAPFAHMPGSPYTPYMPTQPPGYKQGISVRPGSHSPMLALFVSLFGFVFSGQFYNKQISKGMLFLVFAVVLAVATKGASVLFTWPLAAVDAYIIAKRLNAGEIVGDWEWVWGNSTLPRGKVNQGLIYLGILLIATFSIVIALAAAYAPEQKQAHAETTNSNQTNYPDMNYGYSNRDTPAYTPPPLSVEDHNYVPVEDPLQGHVTPEEIKAAESTVAVPQRRIHVKHRR